MISVGLCTYNGSKYIREQLHSIMSQTVPPDEIVICDDLSKDDTVSMAKEVLDAGAIPYRVLINEKNLGYRKNFEHVISLCKGDIIFLSDQDDVWHKDKIEKVAAYFDDPDVVMVHHDDRLVDENLDTLLASYWRGMKFPLERFRKCDLRPLFLRNYVQGSACAFRRKVFEVAAPFPECAVHDEWLALIAMHMGKIISIDSLLMDYRQWGNNSIGVHVTSIADKINIYRHRFKIRMKTHIQEVHNREDIFRALKTRLEERHIPSITSNNMPEFERKRLRFINKKSFIPPILEYYSYCGFLEDTKQLLKDVLARTVSEDLK